MSIDDKVECVEVEKNGPRCFHKGKYYYRSFDKEKNQAYCCLSDDRCIYYKRENNKEFCTVRIHTDYNKK